MDANEKQTLVDSVLWYHSIDLGDGIVTKGLSQNKIEDTVFPDPQGKSVLDIGAWDGLYSYWAERQGASRVVAMDHYVWGLDFGKRQAYWQECRDKGEFPDHSRDFTDFWDDSLPGKRAFDIAHRILDSKVESVVQDFATADPDTVGRFDLVFFLGVLYHLKEPFTSLEQIRRLTAPGGTAVIETEAMALLEHEDEALCEFLPGGEINADYGNWFVLSEAALVGMCRAAGFSKVDVLREAPAPPIAEPSAPTLLSRPGDRRNYENTQRARRELRRYRIVVQAHA